VLKLISDSPPNPLSAGREGEYVIVYEKVIGRRLNVIFTDNKKFLI